MSTGFVSVQWNRAKIVYDLCVAVGVTVFVAVFATLHWQWHPPKDLPEAIDIWIRTTGVCAYLMLTAILCIGPLARLSPRFLPLLYNRRHFGVMACLVAVTHFGLMLSWYIVQGNLPNLAAELTTWPAYAKFIDFPFKALGFLALLIMVTMAATSHDFWLMVLTPLVWKALHMSVYVAYGLVVGHVALGTMQGEATILIPLMLIGGFGAVTALHLVAAAREAQRDRAAAEPDDGWLVVGPPHQIPDRRAKIVLAPGGERIAVFRDGQRIAALSNVCVHQNGPVGEGHVADGCATCPWHGYQYRLTDGCAPEPYSEKIATFRVRLRDGAIEVDPRALPPGTPASILLP